MALTSLRFAANPRLQSASENNPPLKRGETGEAVVIYQQALIDSGFPLPISTRKGTPDGDYGNETFSVTLQFQIRNKLIYKDGNAGRETLHKLDKLLPGTPFKPVPTPVPPSDQQLIDAAFVASRTALVLAVASLRALEEALKSGNAFGAFQFIHQQSIDAIEHWLKTKVSDPLFSATVATARSLMEKNLAIQTTIVHQPQTGPDCSQGGFAWTNPSRPDLNCRCCEAFFKTGPNYRRDVITHEFFHLVGLGHGGNAARATITRKQTLDSSDNMAQLVTEINAGRAATDGCISGR